MVFEVEGGVLNCCGKTVGMQERIQSIEQHLPPTLSNDQVGMQE